MVLCVGDLHLSDVPPSQCTDSYNDDLFVLLQEIVEIARDRAVDAVVFSGDIFHIKRPSRTSHKTVQRMIGVVQSFSCPVYSVIGNHDIQQDRLMSVFETQPFGVLLRAGLRLLRGWDREGLLPLYGVSWQQDWQNASEAFLGWRDSPRRDALLVTHAPVYPPGRELVYENVLASVVADWAGNKGFLYYGHVHDYHGVFEAGGVVFCNQGAVSRGSLQESDLSRLPAVTVWHSSVSGPAAFERVVLRSARPGAEVFRVVEAAARLDYRDRLEVFLAAVGASTVNTASIEDLIAHVRGLGLSESETKLAVEVLMDAVSGG